jgi:hypothetical protein
MLAEHVACDLKQNTDTVESHTHTHTHRHVTFGDRLSIKYCKKERCVRDCLFSLFRLSRHSQGFTRILHSDSSLKIYETC